MICHETREYLFAFLDSELDAPLSIELQRHIDGCPGCARDAEIERTIGRHLGQVLEAGSAEVLADEDELRHMVGRITTHRDVRAVWFAPRINRPLAAAALLVLVVGAAAWFAFRGGGADTGYARFADLVVTDFEHFLETGRPVQIASGDREVVSSWLRERTVLAVVLPAVGDSQRKLLGGRKCKIDGRVAAFAVYDMNGVPASLVVTAAGYGQLDGMKQVRRNGRTHWVRRLRGYTVVACLRDELVYAAISTLAGEEDLLCLMVRTADATGDRRNQ